MSSPPASGATSALAARDAMSLAATALLALLAAGDDLGGAPTKPTFTFSTT
ncbi:MAG TPA: hypothetical protein VMV37_10725 [Gammaproteobacteria bacterium]|nr:hypothetical protein [Gammaproteobacteria bacterium]